MGEKRCMTLWAGLGLPFLGWIGHVHSISTIGDEEGSEVTSHMLVDLVFFINFSEIYGEVIPRCTCFVMAEMILLMS